jgi:hypothetical protein
MWRLFIFFVGATAWTCLGGFGQEAGDEGVQKEKIPKRSVRFLPVGEAPPFRQEIRDGVRHELPPPVGSLPPREVTLGIADAKAGELTLRLRKLSGAVQIAEGAHPLVLRDKEKEAEPWHAINLPETGDVLAILWRDAKAGSWVKARSLVVPHSLEAVPAGTILISNVSPVHLVIIMGKDTFSLAPRKSVRKNVGVVDGELLRIGFRRDGEVQPFYSSGLVLNPKERSTLVIYLADSEKPRRPLQVTVLREKVP